MNQLLATGVQALVATDRYGRSEPLIVSVVERPLDGDRGLNVSAATVETLERVMDVTGYVQLLSFSIQSAYLSFMEARALFVMNELFEQGDRILLARCDGLEAAKAFINEIRKTYQLTARFPARNPRTRPGTEGAEAMHVSA